MTKTPKSSRRLERAKDYIAIAESADSKREAYIKAAEEIAAARAEGVSASAVATAIGKSEIEVRRFTDWHKSGYKAATPWLADEKATDRAAMSHTKATLRKADQDQIKRIMVELPDEQLSNIASEAGSTLVSRSRAKRAEHHAEPTAGELMAGEKWDPSESWADTLVIAVNNKVREFGSHVKHWGLVLNTMPTEEAYKYLLEAERTLADARAALQERLEMVTN